MTSRIQRSVNDPIGMILATRLSLHEKTLTIYNMYIRLVAHVTLITIILFPILNKLHWLPVRYRHILYLKFKVY